MAPGASHGSAVLSPADLHDKEDTQLRKVRCLVKIRQNLRGFFSFISRPTFINPQSKTVSASVWAGSSNGSKLPCIPRKDRDAAQIFHFSKCPFPGNQLLLNAA